jgi:hypothetical protein
MSRRYSRRWKRELDGRTVKAAIDEAAFWSIIEEGLHASPDDSDAQAEVVRARLRTLSPTDVRAFERIFDEKHATAYSWDLWGAAYWINGGCSDDGFAYFRAWVISRGKPVYDAAVENPDSLAAHVDRQRDDYEAEDLWYAPGQVYRELTGAEMPRGESLEPAEPTGARWDFDDEEELARRFPRLACLYLE